MSKRGLFPSIPIRVFFSCFLYHTQRRRIQEGGENNEITFEIYETNLYMQSKRHSE